MGYEDKRNDARFVTLAQGTMYYKTDEHDPKGILTTGSLNDGSSYSFYKKEIGAFTGKITSMQYQIHEKFGTKLNIRIEDYDDVIILQIKSDSSTHDSLLNSLANCDLSKKVRISASKGKEGKGTNVWVQQNGININWKFTKENPGNVPKAVVKKIQGKESWDFSEIHNFWYEYCINELIPSIQGDSASTETNTSKSDNISKNTEKLVEKVQEQTISDEENDDLPF